MGKKGTGNTAILSKAITLHKEGNLKAAENAYRQVIAKEASNSIALVNLGKLYSAAGQWKDAEVYLKRAIRASIPTAELNYSLALALQQLGKLDEAMSYYHQAIAIRPNHPAAYANLGVILCIQEKFEEAQKIYQQAISLQPNYPEAHYNLGLTLKVQGQIEESVACFEKAIALKQNYADAYFNLGLVLNDLKKVNEAITAFEHAISQRPDYYEAYYNLGLTLLLAGNKEQAFKCFQQTLSICPNYVAAHHNLGTLFKEQQQLDKAIESYQVALAYNPDLSQTLYNLGLIFHEKGQLAEALLAYQKAIALNQEYSSAHFSLSTLLLQLKQYEVGWKEYEWRFIEKDECYNLPPLDSIDGARELLIIEEQGIGDLLQFMRYAGTLKQKFPTVSISVRESLIKLVEMTQLFDHVYPLQIKADILKDDTKWLYLMSIPKYLNLKLEDLSWDDVYIKPDPERVEYWKNKLNKQSSLLVGMNWQGNPKAEVNNFEGRSLPLAEFSPLSAVSGIELLSLQKGFGSEQLDSCPFRDRFVDCQDEISNTWDWVETASILANCDLIITSDTSIAHLAGAMGKPVWILLKKVPEWRWGLEGETSPWYPTARLFRQQEAGNWAEVMQRVKAELLELKLEKI